MGAAAVDPLGRRVSMPDESRRTGASVIAKDVRHVYENGFEAITPTTLEVESATFCTLLGPSGSGKTTLLRVLAGLLSPTAGQVIIGGRDVTRLPVQKRDIGFVFQHYALFPHMTAYQNIEYPLKIRGWSRDARRRTCRGSTRSDRPSWLRSQSTRTPQWWATAARCGGQSLGVSTEGAPARRAARGTRSKAQAAARRRSPANPATDPHDRDLCHP